MPFLSRSVFLPHAGKSDIVIERLKVVGGAIARAGGEPQLVRISHGHMAGHLALFGAYKDFITAAAASVKISNDAAYKRVAKLRDKNPASTMVLGPDVARVVYGALTYSAVGMVRTYQIDRRNLEKAIDILGEVEKLSRKRAKGARVTGIIPMIADNVDRLNVVYGFDSIKHMSEEVQWALTSIEFQKLVMKAHTHGKLISVRVQQRIDI